MASSTRGNIRCCSPPSSAARWSPRSSRTPISCRNTCCQSSYRQRRRRPRRRGWTQKRKGNRRKGGLVMLFRKILVAFDGSEGSWKAFDFALELSALCKENGYPEIYVLSVVSPPEPIEIVEMEAVIDAATTL